MSPTLATLLVVGAQWAHFKVRNPWTNKFLPSFLPESHCSPNNPLSRSKPARLDRSRLYHPTSCEPKGSLTRHEESKLRACLRAR